MPSGIVAIIGSMAEPGDRVEPDDDDFRRVRAYLAPHLFLEGEKGQTYPPPTDLIDEEEWESMMALPTHVALATSSYTGTQIATIHRLHSDWIFSSPDYGKAPFMNEACLLADEEFDALTFNALHGYYRQAIGCLRNALEIMAVAASLAVEGQGVSRDFGSLLPPPPVRLGGVQPRSGAAGSTGGPLERWARFENALRRWLL